MVLNHLALNQEIDIIIVIMNNKIKTKYKFKYFLDLIFATFLIILLFPIIFIPVSFIVKITSKGPIIFKQKRIGQYKKAFLIYKFRTMRIDAPKDVPTHKLKNATSWITPIGSFLRKTSIDEFPQLFNILKGQMSFVGPRPALWNQDDLIRERDFYELNSLRPGLSGLAQIKGRDTLSIPLKVKLDSEYMKKMSFCFDLSIILKTILKIIKDDKVIEGEKLKSK
jgi:O-antigen biosynthesis protein WbqP